jgi:hypothetical protein
VSRNKAVPVAEGGSRITKATLLNWIRAGSFPRPFTMGGRGRASRRYWRVVDIEAKLAQLAKEGDPDHAA